MQEFEFNLPPQRRYTPAQRAALLAARKKRKAARRRKQILFLASCVLVLGLAGAGAVKLVTFTAAAISAAEWQVFSAGVSDALPSTSGGASSQDVVVYDEVSYDVSGYVYDAGDARLLLVNANLPLGDGYFIKTAVADDVTGETLAEEAAESYRAMASAASADGISLVLTAGYHDADAQQAIFDGWQQVYLDEGYTATEAYDLAATVVSTAEASEHLTGYGADIGTAEYDAQDIGFADTAAFAWLTRYATEYGFILRYPEDKQMITGVVYAPWHWRYVGVENAKAIVDSDLTLEEFIEAEGVF